MQSPTTATVPEPTQVGSITILLFDKMSAKNLLHLVNITIFLQYCNVTQHYTHCLHPAHTAVVCAAEPLKSLVVHNVLSSLLQARCSSGSMRPVEPSDWKSTNVVCQAAGTSHLLTAGWAVPCASHHGRGAGSAGGKTLTTFMNAIICILVLTNNMNVFCTLLNRLPSFSAVGVVVLAVV